MGELEEKYRKLMEGLDLISDEQIEARISEVLGKFKKAKITLKEPMEIKRKEIESMFIFAYNTLKFELDDRKLYDFVQTGEYTLVIITVMGKINAFFLSENKELTNQEIVDIAHLRLILELKSRG